MSHPAHDDHGPASPESHGDKPSATSAVAIPLVALGLLAAAVWLGTKPAAVPAPEAVATGVAPAKPGDPLPSWNDGEPKRAILAFVKAVTDESCRPSSRGPNASRSSTTTARSSARSR